MILNHPRLMIAGTGGDSGKTLVALGLITALRREGITIAPFKKGPDYIDPAWLAMAGGRNVYNLDTWMMGAQRVVRSFIKHAVSRGINLIEANRGLHDGEDASGSHSSGEMAKLLHCPVILVIPAVKVTRTVAAIALGIKMLDPDVPIAGVVINQVVNKRQKAIIVRAVEEEAGLPVMGSLPRMKKDPLPGRHLGLVTPEESRQAEKAIETAGDLVGDNVDLKRIRRTAEETVPLISPKFSPDISDAIGDRYSERQLKIGYFTGSAFTFYYPENIEALKDGNVTLLPVNPFELKDLPQLDALYIGGGFPETHAAALADNSQFRQSLVKMVKGGLPVYAECGGLMFLCRSLKWQNSIYPMAGVFDTDIEISRKPQGHGYQEVEVDRPNAFFDTGVKIRGHEFHYSRLSTTENVSTVFKVNRGTGIGQGRDGLIYKNVLACYLHLHATGNKNWAAGIKRAAQQYNKSRNSEE